MDIEHTPGWRNGVADALSRMTELGRTRDALREMRKNTTDTTALGAVWRTGDGLTGRMALIRGYHGDSYTQGLRARLVADQAPLTIGARRYQLQNGLIYSRRLCDSDTSAPDDTLHGWKLYVPNGPNRIRVLQAYHDSPEAGHRGYQKTLELCARKCWWKGMGLDVRDYVSSCPECQRSKVDHGRARGTLQPLQFPTRKWMDISMDFVTGLPRTTRNKDAILTVVDRCTKMTHLIPLNVMSSAADVAALFLKEIWRLHGVPRSIVSDRDGRFVSAFWQELMRLLGTRLRMSSAFHPQTDGQTERANDVAETTLRLYTEYDATDWDLQLPTVEFTMNNTVHASTGYTPFYLYQGYHPDALADLLSEAGEGKVESVNDWTKRLVKDIEKAESSVRTAQERMKQ